MDDDKRVYKLVLFSRTVGTFGNTLFYPVMLLATTLTGQVYVLSSLATLSENIPLLLGPMLISCSQVIHNKPRLLIVSAILRCICYILIALLFLNISFISVLLAILLNFISDTFGILVNPIETQCVVNTSEGEELEKKFGKLNSFSQVAALIAIVFGGILTELFSSWVIALINAAIFLALAVYYLRTKLLLQNILSLSEEGAPKEQNFLRQTRKNMHSILENKSLIMILMIIGVLNVIFALIPYLNNIIFGIHMDHYNIYLFSTMLVLSIGMIVGGISSAYLKPFTFIRSVALYTPLIAGTFIAYYFAQPLALLLLFLLIGFISGLLQAKFFSTVLLFVPESEIGYLGSVMDIIVRIFAPVFLLISSLGIKYVGIQAMLLIFALILSIMLITAISYLAQRIKK